MDVSIAIPCRNEMRIVSTLASIDEDVEITCGITPDPAIERLLGSRGVRYAVTPRSSHSIATNAAVGISTRSKVLMIDSDCCFVPGAIRRLSDELDSHDVVKGRVVFGDDGTRISRLIAQCRDFDHTYESPAYKVGLGVRRSVIERLGGRLFNENLAWTVDADLSFRLARLAIPVRHVDFPSVHHGPTSLEHNLKSCYQYGKGDCIRSVILGQRRASSFWEYEAMRYRALWATRPFDVGLFMLTNDAFYHAGFVAMRLRLLATRLRELVGDSG